MKRTVLLRRCTPATTGFKRRHPRPFALSNRKTLERHAAIKRRTKKPTVEEGAKYLAACHGEECYLRVPGVCRAIGWQCETVVPCHSNQSRHGKGCALKARHEFTVPGCALCHTWLDQGGAPRAAKIATFDDALERWIPVRARKMGIEVEGEA